MRRWLWMVLALGGCTPSPGLVADQAESAPSVRVEGEVDGSTASLRVLGSGIGSAFGLSLHVQVDDALIAYADAAQLPVLGDRAVLLARIEGADVAFGGTRPSIDAGEADIADGTLATIELRGRAAGSSRVEIIDALARRVDGSFIPLAASGATLTLEAP